MLQFLTLIRGSSEYPAEIRLWGWDDSESAHKRQDLNHSVIKFIPETCLSCAAYVSYFVIEGLSAKHLVESGHGPTWKHVRLQPSIFFVGTFVLKRKSFGLCFWDLFVCLPRVEHFRQVFVCRSVSMNGRNKSVHAEIKRHRLNLEVTLAQTWKYSFP